MNSYKILSLNGGGVRGALTVRLLERLNASIPFIDSTDLFAGVSTGGLIAASCAFGIDLNQIKKFYINECPFIFRDNIFDDINDLFGLNGADYDIVNLEIVLKRIFGETKLTKYWFYCRSSLQIF